jgi:hypothetical protein
LKSPCVWHTPGVSTTSDVATLSSVVAQVEELSRRVTEIAERYGETPDSAIAAELFASERGLAGARRSLDRAMSLLDQLRD